MTKTILVIDDDPKLCDIISLNLKASGYHVLVAHDGRSGLATCREAQPDLVVLDVMMPGINGFDVCQTLREEPGFPDCSILMLTALGEIEHKGEGFRTGADDYLLKPFDPRELIWRAEALLRRLRRPHLPTVPQSFGELHLHPATLEVQTPQKRVKLTQIEFTLLMVLAEAANAVVPPEHLARRVWGSDGDEMLSALRVHVNRIRQRLEPDPAAPCYLRTVRGRGYQLITG